MSCSADARRSRIEQSVLPWLPGEACTESFRRRWLSGIVVAAVFLGVSLLSSPIPGVNEPHYLCKARAFDDPTWCSRDFFLTSASVHYCFFVVTGFLTRWLSLDAIAVIGRAVSVALLAAGWTMLGHSLRLGAAWRILAAGMFATISQLGSFSGEWLLGGFESKVPAWGLCLAAISLWIRGQLQSCPGWMTAAGVVCGLACSLHPVVGGWVAACLCMVSLAGLSAAFSRIVRFHFRRMGQARGANSDTGTVRLLKPLIGIALFTVATILIALPGLIPALQMVLDQSNPQKDRELASFVQVFWRLKHHLDPTELLPSQWLYATVLCGGISVGSRRLTILTRPTQRAIESDTRQPSRAWNSLLTVFVMSALIAFSGIVIGWHRAWTHPDKIGGEFTALAQFVLGRDSEIAQELDSWQWRASLLKFYPFRAFDALLPIVASFVLAGLSQVMTVRSQRLTTNRHAGVLLLSVALPLALACFGREGAPPGYSADQFTEWQEACRWIRENTPESSLVLTPRESFAFKWLAERAEFVCYKDCPQDTAGILTWNKRLWLLHDWTLNSSSDGRYDTADLKTLRGQTDCDYILTRILGPFDEEPLWQSREWRIYSVPE